ncbi:hypothetical protein SAMN05421874_12814 [Nonomuraea maritima]|uniref:Uncharacterized protein n=1 Tax=Nonomuraea maritima TaxID=683260 RepID=A0A1G9MFU1_9ACTN|nr:hypothetical protein [Nonomuraea maritima]SDL72861.1 hypothetical protein SAMN05421874_12814 [Nonomuraea maritima]
MELFTPPDTDMSLPIGDDPNGGAGPDLEKVDQAAKLFYQYGHASRRSIYSGGQSLVRSDRAWFVCVRDAPADQPVRWLLYAIAERAFGVASYQTAPVSAVEFAQGLATQGRTVVVRRYDNYDIAYSLDGESIPL